MDFLKKFFKVIIVIFCIALVLLVISAISMGLFSKVELEQTQRGPYKIACLSHSGSYYLIYKKIAKVDSILSEQNIPTINACAIYYDDPAEVPEEELRSKGGFIIDSEIDSIPGLEIEFIPEREVIVGSFKGHPSIAALKIYPKIDKWMVENDYYSAGCGLEIYKEKIVESEMPIKLVN